IADIRRVTIARYITRRYKASTLELPSWGCTGGSSARVHFATDVRTGCPGLRGASGCATADRSPTGESGPFAAAGHEEFSDGPRRGLARHLGRGEDAAVLAAARQETSTVVSVGWRRDCPSITIRR